VICIGFSTREALRETDTDTVREQEVFIGIVGMSPEEAEGAAALWQRDECCQSLSHPSL